MFDIGWQELFIVAVLTVVVVGPKELPRVLRTVTMYIRKIRSITSDFQRGVDDIVREADLEEVRRDIQSAERWDMSAEVQKLVDEDGELEERLKLDEVAKDLDDIVRDRNPVPSGGTESGPGIDDVPAQETQTSNG